MPFHSIQAYMDGPRAMTDGKVSAYHAWKHVQPGYMNPEPRDIGKLGYLFSSTRDIAWDGTFTQPVLPLADQYSKHLKGSRLI